MMKVRLLREASIRHKAGEIVEVSPAEYGFLKGVGSAVDIEAEPVSDAEGVKIAKKTTKKK